MVAHSLYYRTDPTVSYAESLPGYTVDIGLPGSGAIERNIADDYVTLGGQSRPSAGVNDDFAA